MICQFTINKLTKKYIKNITDLIDQNLSHECMIV